MAETVGGGEDTQSMHFQNGLCVFAIAYDPARLRGG
jgi:hypothetical protein